MKFQNIIEKNDIGIHIYGLETLIFSKWKCTFYPKLLHHIWMHINWQDFSNIYTKIQRKLDSKEKFEGKRNLAGLESVLVEVFYNA